MSLRPPFDLALITQEQMIFFHTLPKQKIKGNQRVFQGIGHAETQVNEVLIKFWFDR
jgi:hypothetical protein